MARTFPVAFMTRASRSSSIESASITESPCHNRACPVYSARPAFEFACIRSAEIFAGTGASCGSPPLAGNSVEGGEPQLAPVPANISADRMRSEEHTSELQSHLNLVCRLLLEK